jgi:Holliday junction resolvase RusA-like endonuclease
MKITIDGVPIAKTRHKCACRANKPVIYDPQIKDQMNPVQNTILASLKGLFENDDAEIRQEVVGISKANSFSVSFAFLFPPPATDSLKERNRKLWGLQPYCKKPDIDNLEKFYLDCATGIIWPDDSIVSVIRSKKCYDENPRTEMEIMVKKDLNVDVITQKVLEVLGPSKMKEFLKDVSAFWPWPPERIDEVVGSDRESDKESALSAAARLLSDFATKYASDLKKIQRAHE